MTTPPPIQPSDSNYAPAPMAQYANFAPPPDAPRKPGVLLPYLMLPMAWGVLIFTGIILGVIVLLVSGPSLASGPEAMEQFFLQPRVFWFVTLIPFIPLAIFPLLLSLKTPEGFRRRLSFNAPRASWLTIAIISLGILGGSILISWVMEQIQWVPKNMEELGQVLSSGDAFDSVMAIFTIGLLGPLAEELVFRGFIQTRLVARHGPRAGILITSAFFAVWHMYPAHVVSVFPIGLLFGWAAWKTNSIWTSVAAHMLNNTAAVVLGLIVATPDAQKIMTWVSLPLGAIALAGAIYVLVKMKPPPKQEFIGFPIS